MLKKMQYDKDAIQLMADGILMVCKLLEPTYGPRGLSVVVENQSQSVVVTGDCRQILEGFRSSDLYIDEGVQLVKEAIFNVAEQVGDGSTLTALLVKGMVEQGLRYVAAGIPTVYLRRGLKKALEIVLKDIDNSTKKVDKSEQLICGVKAACGDSEIAALAVEAYNKVSTKGVVLVKPTNHVENRLEYEEGMRIKEGYISSLFCAKGNDRIHYTDPFVLITNYKITSFATILPILEQIIKIGNPLVIIAQEVIDEALTMLIHNHTQGILKVVAIKAEGYKTRKADLLEDIAILTGGEVIREDRGDMLKNVTVDMLGRAKQIMISKSETTIIGGKGAEWKINKRLQDIQEIIEDEKTNPYDKEKYRERMGRLKNGVAILYAGGRTSQETREMKSRMESAVKAARNIIDGGVVPGGGSYLHHISSVLENTTMISHKGESYGGLILQSACNTPIKTLLHLVGKDITVLDEIDTCNIQYSKMGTYGYDIDLEVVTNMEKNGVLDSAIMIKMALVQAVSVVYEWLDTAVLMVSTAPDREDLELMKEGVPIMR